MIFSSEGLEDAWDLSLNDFSSVHQATGTRIASYGPPSEIPVHMRIHNRVASKTGSATESYKVFQISSVRTLGYVPCCSGACFV